MKLTNLRDYVEQHKQWYLEKYGELNWKWYDEGLYYSIADYYCMRGEFSAEDVVFLHENEFTVEDFTDEE